MKIVALNGSCNREGNTYQALQIAAGELEAQGIKVETVNIGAKSFRGCTGCHSCKATGRCVLSEPEFSEILDKMYEADGIILGSPVYYGGITGPMKSFLDRAFFSSTAGQLRFKVAASVVVLRRAGAMSAYEQLNNYLLASEMLVVPCQWMAVFGAQPGEINEDKEGLQRLRNLGRNMAWLMKMKDMTKDTLTMPASEARVFFNMIR
jgi:multimeric flavodoxin WrbA